MPHSHSHGRGQPRSPHSGSPSRNGNCQVRILVLNYNGRDLLLSCLPSVLEAAAQSRYGAKVAVVDNASTDDSPSYLTQYFPSVPVVRHENRGLCSFNDVLDSVSEPVVILLNNDIRLARGSIDPLVAPLFESIEASQQRLAAEEDGSPWSEEDEHIERCYMTAPRCYQFDETSYEGFKTAVRLHWGLVQATALFDGHELAIETPDLTASAGAVMAVRRDRFLQLGGFDPLYLPGRIEDLDFAFRAFLAGYHARYVPKSVAYHRGMASFREAFGREGCDRLALRNTLLFQLKNIRSPIICFEEIVGWAARLAADLVTGPFREAGQRFAFTRACIDAIKRFRRCRRERRRAMQSGKPHSSAADFAALGRHGPMAREHQFFYRFAAARLRRPPTAPTQEAATVELPRPRRGDVSKTPDTPGIRRI